jgi:phage shock protein PspC (stress-responsive transcriptional regulator)
MKKTITVNLNGRVFTMDEDAYRLLNNYLDNLWIYFRKEEGTAEIIADFEARIEELFSEKIRLGYQVITIEQVEEVIARVGKPDDFAEPVEVDEDKQTYFTESKEVKKKFYRNMDDKMFGGVCSGIAAYFGWDVLVLRIIFIILLFVTQLLIVPAYILTWILVSGANTAEQKLQMRGKPITIENIGKTVAAEVEPPTPTQKSGCLSGFIDLTVGLLKVFLIGLGCLVGLPLIFFLFIVIIVLVAVLFGAGGGLMGAASPFLFLGNPILATTTFIFVIGIPIVALLYVIISYFAKWKPLKGSVKITFLIIWILALALLVSSGFRFNKNGLRKWEWTKWSVSIDGKDPIRGNGIFSEKTYVLENQIEYVTFGNHLYAHIQIEQVQDETSSIVISGDENLVDQIKYKFYDGLLTFSSNNTLHSENNLLIKIKSRDLKGIRSNYLGNIKMNRAFVGDALEIKMNGPARFSADSLYVQSLSVHSEGIASIHLSGKANYARLNLMGAGKIDALELLSDTVYASLEGVGSIQCNPVELLEGRLQGIGKITYKEEPKMKNITSEGIGKIGKK